MKKVLLLSLAMIGAAQSALAANKSITTQVTEGMSSSSYSKVECSMEDYTCQKLIVDMGRQEALSRVLSGETGKISVVLQQSISIVRENDEGAKNLTDAQIIEILATEQ